MFNPYYLSSSSQNQIQKKFPYETHESTFSIYNPNEFLYQNLIATMNAQRKMMEEIDDIKLEIGKLKDQNTTYAEKILELQNQKQQEGSDERRRRKIFKKNIQCPHLTCPNKYSSKIALNSHVRAKHKKIQNLTAQSKTPDNNHL